MIGGDDVCLARPATTTPVILDAIYRAVTTIWPHRVVQQDLPSQAFIYKNPEATLAWARDGAPDNNDHTMIHVLVGGSTVTIVVDDRARLGGIIQQIKTALSQLAHH